MMGLKAESHRAPGIAEVGERRIREMDAQGIDVEVISINPHWYEAERDTAAEIVRINNERLADSAGLIPTASPRLLRWRCSFRSSLSNSSNTP